MAWSILAKVVRLRVYKHFNNSLYSNLVPLDRWKLIFLYIVVLYMRFKEPLCRSRRHRNVDDGLRGLAAVLPVVMIVSAMSSANVTDDDSGSCSGTVAVSTVAAAAEHDASTAEDQLLFLKVRGDPVADASSLTFWTVVSSCGFLHPHHPLINMYCCCYRNRPTGIENQLRRVLANKNHQYPSSTLPEGTRAKAALFGWEYCCSSSFVQLSEDKI